MGKLKYFDFDKEMDTDFEMIKRMFQKKFKVRPSNRAVMDLLLRTYKESNLTVNKKPKSRKKFIMEF